MYKLSVGALFKNESHSIREWIEHYLYHGVDHFYLIDDSSTDNSIEIIQPYIDNGIVTLFSGNNWGYYLGRQMNMYNHFIMPRLQESEWLLIVDLDEYVWSPQSIDLKFILNQCRHIGQIQINNTVFGSNGHRRQPKSLVAGFTKRAEMKPTITPECGNLKYFVNTSFNFTSLNIHHATFLDKNDEIHKFVKLDLPYFVLNHYNCQSVNFWNDVKCTRGDGDHYRVRTHDDFKIYDFNDVEDTELYEQNKELIERLGLI
jgi:hypothetical protein